MRFIKHIRNTIVFVFLLNLIKAQDHGFFNQVWLEEGLSQSSISSIVQDQKGLMWFGTQDGLNRYDGRLIEHYNFKPFDSKSISGDDITGFCIKDNLLYIISAGGLDVMDLNTQSVKHYKEILQEKERSAVLTRIWNINNTIYLSTNKGFCALAVQDNKFKIEPIKFEENQKSELRTIVLAVASSGNNNIYAATNKGVFVKEVEKSFFRPLFDITNITKTEPNTALEFQTLLFYKNKLYFSLAHQFYVYDVPSSNLKNIPLPLKSPTLISTGFIDNLSRIWLGTNGEGIVRLNGLLQDSVYLEKTFSKNSNEQFGLQSNDITSIYQNTNSNSDIVWVGTRDAGVFNYSYSKNSFDLASSILKSSEPNYFGIVKDEDGIIWCGFNYGILKLDRKNKTYYNINLGEQLSKLQRFIEAIYCDDENTIWTGFGNALYKIDKKKNVLIPVLENIYPGKRNHAVRIVKSNETEILLCNTHGILIYNVKNGAIEHRTDVEVNGEKIKIEGSNSFFIDSKNNWWIGSAKGLLYINNTTGKGKYFNHLVNDTNSLVSNRIMDINETKNGEIIVATTKGLSILSKVDGNTQFKNYHNVKGLSNNFIYGLLRDDKGNFWMSTNFGLSVFNPITSTFKSYSASDGVCINEFNSAGFHKSLDGEFLFGGIGGLVSVYPNQQIINKTVPDIFLKSLRIENYNDSISGTDNTLLLNYNQNKINFEFIVPDFSGPDNINLFYRFSTSTKWTQINPSKVFSLFFPKLAPGNYNLEIIAVNSEGIQSKPLTYSFIINPPFWNTWWFFLIIVVAVIIATWAIYRIRLHNKIEHIKEVERVRKEENEKVRKAAALDLHDEFGNGLTRISMLIEMARIHIPKENTEATTILDVISQNSQRLYQGTKDFIWSINPGNDNLYEIIIRVKDFGDELFYGTGCTFEVIGLKDEYRQIKQLPSAGRNITMIFKEALSNIIKHSKATKVELIIENASNIVTIRLKDNGVGFDTPVSKNSFGLSNMQQRSARAGASITINSEKNKGTEITLTIKNNSHANESNT